MKRQTVIYIIAGVALILTAAVVYYNLVILSHNPLEKYTSINRARKPVITDFIIDPQGPISSDYIRAVPVTDIPGLKADIKFKYQWFINNKEVENNDKLLLDKTQNSYKKGDTVYCKITVFKKDGDTLHFETNKATIQNSPPFIKQTVVPEFSVPGHFKFNIRAADPDGDPLKYRLISPKQYGIMINPETGELDWEILEVPRKANESVEVPRNANDSVELSQAGLTPENRKDTSLPGVVSIRFEVMDNSGGSVTGSIALNLLTGREETQ